MQFDIQAVNFELTAAIRMHLVRRLNFALRPFEERIVRVSVRLSDLNGPRGGVDKACRMRIRLHGISDILIEDAEDDLYVAMSRAADRAGRTLGRRLRRERGDFGAVSRGRDHEWAE